MSMIYSETESRSDRSDLILMVIYSAMASLPAWMAGLVFEIKVAKLSNHESVFSLLAFSVGYSLFYFIGFNTTEWRKRIRLPAQGTMRQVFFSLVTLPFQVFILNFFLFNNYLLSAYVVIGSCISAIIGSLIGREVAKSHIHVKHKLLAGLVTFILIVFLLLVYRLHLEAGVVEESFNRLRATL